MNATEVTALLTVCASFDGRKPNPETIPAWTAALGDLDFLAARDAVVAHYQNSREWIMPADIRRTVRRNRASRIEDEVFHPPADLDPDDTARYIAWLDGERRAVGDGAAPTAPPSMGRRRDVVGELGAAGLRVNAIPTERAASRAAQLRDQARAARAERQASLPPEPEPLLTPADHSREPARMTEPPTPTRMEDQR